MQETKRQIAVLTIIGTEFCERLSFSGLRTILSLFLRNELSIEEHTATIYYHIFIMVCFVVPILGAICADSILGRYRTIVYFSIIYFIGNVLMTLAAIPHLEISPRLLTIVSLFLVAIGAGGIKPCVAAFGGDQFFLPRQSSLLQRFFSMFYFAINLGGFVGMILTPILRKAVTCFGEDTCYALGFGFPSILALLGILLFYMGKPWYRMKKPKNNVMLNFVTFTIDGLWYKIKRIKKRKNGKKTWLQKMSKKYDKKLINDMKIMYAVFLLYVPLPIFWSLFDQQGSRWTFQASRMEGTFFGTQIVPDQVQVVNPALVLILIPIFDQLIYPFFTKFNFLTNPLFRMAFGGFLAGLAFLCAGVLELILEKNYPIFPGKKESAITFINLLPCDVKLRINSADNLSLANSMEMLTFKNLYSDNYTKYKVDIYVPNDCDNYQFYKTYYEDFFYAVEEKMDTALIALNNERKEPELLIVDPKDFTDLLSGKPIIRIAYVKSSDAQLHNVTVTIKNILIGMMDVYFVPDNPEDGLAVSAYMEIPATGYEYYVSSNENSRIYEDTMHLALGGVYLLVLLEDNGQVKASKLYTIFPPNYVNILWLLPQYFLISIAEIMFGIAGLEFSFTQAPKSMKTVSIAAWYLTVALGNFLVIIITKARLFESQAYEFFLFASLMVADMMLFANMASTYKFVQLEADTELFELEEENLPLLEEEQQDKTPNK